MSRLNLVCVVAVLATFALSLPPLSRAEAGASGPDFYRVVDVAPDSALEMRAGPSTDQPVIAAILSDADGIANFGCKGGMTLEQWSSASETQREASRASRWCLVGFDRAVGWAPGRFLAEGRGPDAFRGGSRLGTLSGSEWRVTRFGRQAVESKAWIAFKSDGRVFGDTGCNRLTGGFTQDGAGISVGPLATTRKACPEPLMRFETQFLAILQTAKRTVVTHLVLALLDDQNVVRGQFARTDWD